VLASPDFAAREGRSLGRMLLDSAIWIWERVLDLVAWLFPAAEPGTVWSVGRPIVLVGLALLVLWALARVVRWGPGRLSSERGMHGAADEALEALDAASWSARARAAAGEGRWRDAAMALYHAVLHRLADAGHVRLEPSKTPGDYRREVRGDPAVVRGMSAFVRAFETVAFGAGEPDEAAYRRLEDHAEPLGIRA